MSRKPRIAILTHAIDTFDQGGYLLHRLIRHWEQRGLEIVTHRGPEGTPPEADLAISHFDITAVSDDYARLFEYYPRVINGAVRDISKSLISEQVIARDDAWPGPVIVKTDKNFGGMRELEERYANGDPDASIDLQRPWRRVEYLAEYPVFQNTGEVPSGVWRNPNLVVEKFRPEQDENGQFALRVWVFMGDRGIYYQSISEDSVIKSHNTVKRINLDPAEIPQNLKDRREELGFDYGKFDFGIVDGTALLYDANRTPGSPQSGPATEKVMQNILNLSEGLDTFLHQTRK
jgi:hypothetical protein